MGKSAGEMRQDIDMTRREMAVTIDEIADRASPRRVMDRRRQRVADRWYSMRTAVMGEPDDHGDRRGGMAGGVREMGGSAQDARQRAQDQLGNVADQAREAPQAMARRTRGNPMAAGLVAFGGGLLAASVLPASQAERRAAAGLSRQAGPVQDELRRAGQEVAGELRSSAQDSVEQVKQTSTDAARSVGDHARDSAQGVKDGVPILR